MGRTTEPTIKRLFALSGNLCAFPGCGSPLVEGANASTGEICHIRAQAPGGPRFDPGYASEDLHGFDNLIVLCPSHHTIVDAQPERFTVEALVQMKATHERERGRPERADDVFAARILLRALERAEMINNSGIVVVGSPGAIVGQTINLKSPGKPPKIQPPAGTIGADPDACRYVEYLIGRYNKLASADKGRARPFSYGALSRTIETKFRARWRLLSIGQFEELVGYLQGRISNTRIAKQNTAKGGRSFSSFSDYVQSPTGDV